MVTVLSSTRAALHPECADRHDRGQQLRAKPLPKNWLRLCSKWPLAPSGPAPSPPEAPLMRARLLQKLRSLPAVYAGCACLSREYRNCWKFVSLAETHKDSCVRSRWRKNRLANLGWPEISVRTQAGWRRLGLRLMEPPSAAKTHANVSRRKQPASGPQPQPHSWAAPATEGLSRPDPRSGRSGE